MSNQKHDWDEVQDQILLAASAGPLTKGAIAAKTGLGPRVIHQGIHLLKRRMHESGQTVVLDPQKGGSGLPYLVSVATTMEQAEPSKFREMKRVTTLTESLHAQIEALTSSQDERNRRRAKRALRYLDRVLEEVRDPE